jgi:hypothetical protein
MYVLAGLGGESDPSSTTRNTIVAAFMLYQVFYNVRLSFIPNHHESS